MKPLHHQIHVQMPGRPQQQGAVLIVVLVLLLTAVIMSMGVMRASLSNDVVTNNTRMQSLATEMAQLALRYCERDVIKVESADPSAVVFTKTDIQAKPAEGVQPSWRDKAKWMAAGKTLTLDQIKDASGNSNFINSINSATERPKCLAEYGPGGTVIVTTQGFSPDYSVNSNGDTERGSVVWLQSQFVLNAGTP
jgi:Tfp pilus assembly protein PilX